LVTFGHILTRIIGSRVPENRQVRLERRLAARLERGTDRYFEEKRSIESALAEASSVPPSRPKRWYDIALAAAFVFFLGLIATKWIGPPLLGAKVPQWSDHISTIWMPLWGLSLLVSPTSANLGSHLLERVLGGAVAAVGLLIVVSEFYSFFAKA
jgi:hypothetical protein